jgi:hypothetical protein
VKILQDYSKFMINHSISANNLPVPFPQQTSSNLQSKRILSWNFSTRSADARDVGIENAGKNSSKSLRNRFSEGKFTEFSHAMSKLTFVSPSLFRNVLIKTPTNDGHVIGWFSTRILRISLRPTKNPRSCKSPTAADKGKSQRSRKRLCQRSFKLKVECSRKTLIHAAISITYRRYEIVSFLNVLRITSPKAFSTFV